MRAGIAASTAAALLLGACDRLHGRDGDSDGSGDAEVEVTLPVPVEAEVVRVGDMRRAVIASTTLRGARELGVVAETAGTIRELPVEAGDVVSAGDVLARIVNDEVRIAIDEAQAVVVRNEHEVERLRPLYDRGYLARQTFEEVEFQLESARTSLRRLQTQAGTQTVRAPAAGVVTARPVEVGVVVVPNQPLFTITDTSRLEARVAVPERELLGLREGQPAEIVADAVGGAVVAGHVDRIDPVVNPQAGTVDVTVVLDAPSVTVEDHGEVALRPGMFVTIRIITDVRHDAIAVPKRAIVREAGAPRVFLLGDAVEREAAAPDADVSELLRLPAYNVRRVEVELGYEDGDYVEVRGGVERGDRVIVVGQSGLDIDATVALPNEAPATADGSE
ncbi:MAG: efflux RND transporter periplasmic adaptor subunit [Myxococcales bacterium]|nr:efflux RND transporter periplasmic adaptor subunit [Myxococcales bacterium]MCB9521588.1 efflux RND transporter periplasmic adaptor subunit [Myxococcales bacterium]